MNQLKTHLTWKPNAALQRLLTVLFLLCACLQAKPATWTISPPLGALNVPTTTPVVITFSEPMDITETMIVLPEVHQASWDVTRTILTISPNPLWRSGYGVQVDVIVSSLSGELYGVGSYFWAAASDGGTSNRIPVANQDAATVLEDATININVLQNDTDADSDALTPVIVTGPSKGAAWVQNKSITYTPSANYSGGDTFTYKVFDGKAYSASVAVQVTITAVNDAPTATNDSFSMFKNGSLSIGAPGVLANDSDVDSQGLTAVLASQPANGTVALQSNGAFTYTPRTNFVGADYFTYRASDGETSSAPQAVTLAINQVNEPPVAVEDAYSLNEDSILTVVAPGLLANDFDLNADSLTAVLVQMPSHGIVSLQSDGSFVFTPNADFFGQDSFSYQLSDGKSNSLPVVVNLTIQGIGDPPLPKSDRYTTVLGTPLTIEAPGVVGNDTDPEGGAIRATLIGAAAHGTVVLNADGSFTYTPDPEYLGPDAFSYVATNNQAVSSSVMVNLTVRPPGDIPALTNTPGTLMLAGHRKVEYTGARFKMVTAGPSHNLAITRDGQVFAWGGNNSGESTVPAGLSNIVTAVASGSSSFAIAADGSVVGWGGQNAAYVAKSFTNVVAIASGQYHTLALQKDGTVVTSYGSMPHGLTNVTAIAALANANMALKADGTVTAWGYMYTGEPKVPTNLTGVVGIALTYDRMLAVTSEGKVWEWDTYQVRNNATNLADVIAVAAGAYHSIALKRDGTVYEWTRYTEPVQVAGLTNVASISASQSRSIALKRDGTITIWGDGGTEMAVPAELKHIVDVANYWSSSALLLKTDGTTRYFGYKSGGPSTNLIGIQQVEAGQSFFLALKTNGTVTGFGLAASLTNWTDIADIAGGYAHALALKRDGTVTAWMETQNYSHRYGQATVPAGLSSVVAVSAGNDHSLALRSDGTVVAWGSSMATNVPANATNIIAIAAGYRMSVALRSDGTVLVWGENAADHASAGLTNVAAISAHYMGMALRREGSVAIWGQSSYGEKEALKGIEALGVFASATGILKPNRPPSSSPDSAVVPEDGSVTFTVTSNDVDPEEDAFIAVLASQPRNGSLTFTNGVCTYTPDANYNGVDSFTYKLSDGKADSQAALVEIVVTPVNDVPLAQLDTFDTDEDMLLTRNAAGVLANDIDVDGDKLTPVMVNGAANGSLTLLGDGSFIYTPKTNFNGTDSFTYVVNDGTVDSPPVTVTLNVRPVNDAPTAVLNTYAVDEDQALTIGVPGVLANDGDVEGSTLQSTLVTGPSNGTLLLNPNGSFTYTPRANYHGSDSFQYKANDGEADSAPAVVSIAITPMNDTPVGVSDSYSINEDSVLTVAAPGVLANDTDVEHDVLRAVLVSGPTNGSVTINPNGSFTFISRTNYHGTDSFSYLINDGTADSAPIRVQLTIPSVNDIPVALADSYTTEHNTPLAISAPGILANDTDVDADPLSAILVTSPLNGSITLNSNGSFTYAPKTNYHGSDSFSYKLNDAKADSAAVVVGITVTPPMGGPTLMLKMLGNEVAISFPTVLGRTYRLESTSDVAGGKWTATGAQVVGTGGTMTMSDVGASVKKFYRVTLQ